MKSSTKSVAKSLRDVAYYRQRYENRFHTKLVSWIAEECQRLQITKKEFAERMGKDPGLVSRLLSHPSNLTLDTISDVLLALDAEAEPPEIVKFVDRALPNYVHPLIALTTDVYQEAKRNYGVATTASKETTVRAPNSSNFSVTTAAA